MGTLREVLGMKRARDTRDGDKTVFSIIKYTKGLSGIRESGRGEDGYQLARFVAWR